MEPLASGQQNMTEARRNELCQCVGVMLHFGPEAVPLYNNQHLLDFEWAGNLLHRLNSSPSHQQLAETIVNIFCNEGLVTAAFLQKFPDPSLKHATWPKFCTIHDFLCRMHGFYFHDNSGKKCGNCQPQYMSTAQS